MKRVIMFGIMYGIILFFAYTNRESILIWLNEDNQNYGSHLLWMFLISFSINMIPVIPFTIFSGLMGMKYGIWLGAFINWVGSISAATVFFILARYYFVAFFQKSISQNKHVKNFDQLITQHAFIAILFSRLIPLAPSQVINITSGLSSMLFVHYFVATVLGQIPTMIAFAYLGSQLSLSITSFLLGIVIYITFILLMLMISAYQLYFKKA